MTTPDPKIVRELATEHILDCGRNADDIGAYVMGHFGTDALTKHEYHAYCSAIRSAIRTAVVDLSWPGEQQPADPVSGQQQDGALEAVRRFADAWRESNARDRAHLPSEDGRRYFGDAWFQISGTDAKLTEPQLRAVLVERDALAERVAELESGAAGRLAQAFISGWHDAIDAYRTALGWAEREAAWRKYCEAVGIEHPQHPAPPVTDGGAK